MDLQSLQYQMWLAVKRHLIMAPSKPLKNPRTAAEITKEWVEAVLSQSESETGSGSVVKIKSFQVKPGCAKEDNFTSEVMKLEAEAEVTPAHGTPSLRHFSYYVKFLPGNEMHQEIAKYFGKAKRGRLVLSEVIPALNAFQKERGNDKYHINAPRLVYSACAPGEYVLVMEDLREAGFHVEDKRRGLDLPHLRLVVQHLAHFNAVSYAYCRTHDFLDEYPDFRHNKLYTSILGVLCQVIIEGLQFAFKGREKEFPDMSKFLTLDNTAMVSKIIDILESNETVALVHGDCWTNNIMFKHGEDGTLQDLMMIDWDSASCCSPIYDLQYLLDTCIQDLRRDHLEIQKQYFDIFTSTVTDLGEASPFSGFEDFLSEWRRVAPGRLFFTILGTMMLLSKNVRKLNQGTLSTGLLSTLKVKFTTSVLIPMATAFLVTNMAYYFYKKELKIYFDEMASVSNPEMTERVADLVMAAQRAGVLDL